MLRRWREGLRDDFENGLLQEDTAYKTRVAGAKWLGNLQTVNRILNLDSDTLEQELEEDGES